MVSEKIAALRKKLTTRSTRPARPARQKRQGASATDREARRRPVRTLWWWLSLVVLTASGGFVAPAIAMAFSVTEGWNGTGQFFILTATGLFQGLALGVGEVIALRRGPIRVPIGRWILATTLAMGLAWVIALLPGTFFRPDWSSSVVVVGMIAAVILVILIVPITQWFILRSRVRDAWRWILVMGVATALGVGSLLSGIFLAAGKTTFVKTLLPFILTGWVGVLLFTIVSGLGVFWIAHEAYSANETTAVLNHRAATASKATKATKRVAASAREKTAPVAKKVGVRVAAVAKTVGAKTATAAKRVGAKTTEVAKKAGTRAASATKGKPTGRTKS